MVDTIILQQLKLYFGEGFDEIYANTRSYVKGLIARPWWVDRGALVSSEGPLHRMVEDCLAHVVDKGGDKQDGWQAYTSYLTSLYGSTNKEAQATDMRVALNRPTFVWTTLGGYNNAASLGDNSVVEEHVGDELTIFDEEQADFIAVYSRMGAETAGEEFDMTQEQARTRRNTIRKTIKRRMTAS